MSAMLRAILSRRFLAGWAAGIATSAAAGGAVAAWIVFGGGFDASAVDQHSRPAAWATHNAMRSWVEKQARSVQPISPSTATDVGAGARDYAQHCIACHGGPAVARAKWVSAIIPTPPYLVDSSRRWSREELYVLLRDGIELSAMPAWSLLVPDRTIRELVSFLEALPSMPPAEFARLTAQASAPFPDPGGGMVPPAPADR